MKQIAGFFLLLWAVLLPMAAANADPAGDFEALVKAARDGDPGVDYRALRQAYVLLPIYDPNGKKTKGLIDDAEAAFVKKDCKRALGKFREAIAIDFTLSDAHALSADCMDQMGDKKGAQHESAIAKGLFDSILASGDGRTPQTAFRVVTRHEESVVLQTAGLDVTNQTLAMGKQGPVDGIEVADPKTGKKSAIYFNISAILVGAQMAPSQSH